MKHMAILLFAVIISIYASIVTAKNLLLTGRIITGDTLQPEVEAALIQDGRFTFSGKTCETQCQVVSLGSERQTLYEGVLVSTGMRLSGGYDESGEGCG